MFLTLVFLSHYRSLPSTTQLENVDRGKMIFPGISISKHKKKVGVKKKS